MAKVIMEFAKALYNSSQKSDTLVKLEEYDDILPLSLHQMTLLKK